MEHEVEVVCLLQRDGPKVPFQFRVAVDELESCLFVLVKQHEEFRAQNVEGVRVAGQVAVQDAIHVAVLEEVESDVLDALPDEVAEHVGVAAVEDVK